MGPDGLFSDSISVPVTVAYDGDTTATLSFSALTQNIYRLTVLDTIENTAGVALDGNGTSPSNWVTDFVVVASPVVLGSATPVTVGTTPYAVAVGDFNGDGIADLAVANYASNTVSILLGKGQGGFSLAETLSSGISHPYAVAVGNFNTGGKLDLAVTSYTSQSSNGVVKIFLNNGSTTSPFSSTASSSVNLSGPEPQHWPSAISATAIRTWWWPITATTPAMTASKSS